MCYMPYHYNPIEETLAPNDRSDMDSCDLDDNPGQGEVDGALETYLGMYCHEASTYTRSKTGKSTGGAGAPRPRLSPRHRLPIRSLLLVSRWFMTKIQWY